jgi:hypothetical protein
MYRYQCDYCGEQIAVERGTPYIEARIQFITGNADRLGKPEMLLEPSRFFHAHSVRGLEECDRLGIEVNAEELGDCCYTRALRQLEGVPVTDPGAGLEWRLMPAGETAQEPRHAGTTPPSRSVPPDADMAAFLATLAKAHRTRTQNALRRAGLHTLEQAAAASDDELMRAPGIGWTLRCKLRAFVAAREKSKATA